MTTIKNIERILQVSPNWQPRDCTLIKKLTWQENDLTIHFYCALADKKFVEVVMIFKHVSSLKLDVNGNGYFQVIGFDIIDVSANSWEHINFQIEDYENGRIAFYCKDILIDAVGEPVMLDY